jgi:hypothetical protein
MKSVQNWISILHNFFWNLSQFLAISEIQKKVLTSGARLAVTWSPSVTPQLVVVGGVSCRVHVRVKSPVLTGHSVSECCHSSGKKSPCHLFPRRWQQLAAPHHASRSLLMPSVLLAQVVIATPVLASPPPPSSLAAKEFVAVAARRLPRPASCRSCSATGESPHRPVQLKLPCHRGAPPHRSFEPPAQRRACQVWTPRECAASSWPVSWAAMQPAHEAVGCRGYCAAGRAAAVR